MFAIIRNFVNDFLSWCERRIAFQEGYNLIDNVQIKLNPWEYNYIVNGEDII